MDESPYKPEKFQFSLRTLFMVVTGCSLLFASFQAHWIIGLWALMVYSVVTLILVTESPYVGDRKPPKGALKPSTVWGIVMLVALGVLFISMTL